MTAAEFCVVCLATANDDRTGIYARDKTGYRERMSARYLIASWRSGTHRDYQRIDGTLLGIEAVTTASGAPVCWAHV